MAVSRHRPGRQVAPVEVLRARVNAILAAGRECHQAEVGAALPALIRDVHTSLAAGRDVAELLDLAVMLHVQSASHWLREAGAPLDLRRENDVSLTYRLAEERDTPIALGLATYGVTRVMLAAGAFELAKAELAAVNVPTTTAESTQLAGMLALSQSRVATANSQGADAEAAVEQAVELARHTGEGTAYGLGFGPTNVGLWRMEAMLEIGDHEQVTVLADSLNPDLHPYRSRRSSYWRDYGRALARVRGRHDDAVIASRRAEQIHPHRVQRDPFAREVLGELLLGRRAARWAGNCAGWLTGRDCRCSPSGGGIPASGTQRTWIGDGCRSWARTPPSRRVWWSRAGAGAGSASGERRVFHHGSITNAAGQRPLTLRSLLTYGTCCRWPATNSATAERVPG